MCNKFLQTYACGHSKSICTTPCAHALKSAVSSVDPSPVTHNIGRSDSTVSALVLTEASSSATMTSTRRPHSTTVLSPLRITDSTLTTPQRDAEKVPVFRFVSPSTPPPTSSASPVLPIASVFLTPASSVTPSPPPSVAANKATLVFCAYYIPHYLTTGKHPCIECYGRPEWETLRERWMESYRLGHPLDRSGDVEALSGIKGFSERGGTE
ncbi:hypothetical protein SVAN01_05355 [Stagonosporopsis vannaccii]|nr:hypothetical protein SVAN01_05355 [Stagonosporopsis vannaccii]